ncbi:MAG: hypothetical protein COA58_03150 [Bacteroidetes bacterium]|nr:MAG: hypothetical protein COA58_03150 [Bacteroidota bacterium]
MAINNRVVQLISKTTNSKTSFSQATGISTVILSHISSGRNKVSLTAVEQILKAFPKVSAEWLVLGKGQMFRDGIDNDSANEISENLNLVELEMHRHRKSIDSKIHILKGLIDELNS